MYIIEKAKQIINFFLPDYLAQPAKVTINNIVKELPSFKEIIIPPIVKTYSIAAVSNILTPLTGMAAEELRKDSNYWGSFYQNFISAFKNFLFYLSGERYGSRSYQLYHPASDLLKGSCKLGLLHAGNIYNNPYLKEPLYPNIICEFVQKSFLTGIDEITNKKLDHYSFYDWYQATFTLSFWINVARKAVFQSFTQKFVQKSVITPMSELFAAKAQTIFDKKWLDYLAKDYAIDIGYKEIKIPYLPSAELWARETLTALFLIPLARFVTYSTNKQIKVLVEINDTIKCEEIGNVIKIAQKAQIEAEYKYDAQKHKSMPMDQSFTCEYDKKFTSLNATTISDKNETYVNLTVGGFTNKIIVHYAASDDFVGKMLYHHHEEF